MVTYTQNLCSAFNPSKVHTHTAVSSHSPWTHTRSTGQPFMYLYIYIHTLFNIWSGSKPFIKVVIKQKQNALLNFLDLLQMLTTYICRAVLREVQLVRRDWEGGNAIVKEQFNSWTQASFNNWKMSLFENHHHEHIHCFPVLKTFTYITYSLLNYNVWQQ